MHDSYAYRWSRFVVRNAWVILGVWFVLGGLGRHYAPSWKEVAYDGDFDYLPPEMPSVRGARLINEAFPGDRSRSQIALVLGRFDQDWVPTDDIVGQDLLRRLYHRLGEVSWRRAIRRGYTGGPVAPDSEHGPWVALALEAFDLSIKADDKFYDQVVDHLPDDLPTLTEPRMAIAYWDRAVLRRSLAGESLSGESMAGESMAGEISFDDLGSLEGESTRLAVVAGADAGPALSLNRPLAPDSASEKRFPAGSVSGQPMEDPSQGGDSIASGEARPTPPATFTVTGDQIASDEFAARALVEDIALRVRPVESRDMAGWDPLLDVLSWDEPLVGSRLESDGARLAVLSLSTELAATKNIETVAAVGRLVERVVAYSSRHSDPGLQLLMTGSAAIGGETLTAARSAIQYTEVFTVVMILLILAGVYRAPLLVAVPLVSIGVAVVIAMSLIGLLAQWSMSGSVPGLDVRVFTTSRIFVVVILFGAGTDYCLFLISRLREEAYKAPWPVACRNSLGGVSTALLGSALTTVVGLGMLWFAEFGKFHHTGPIIAICLLVALAVCVTLTPAMLLVLGPRVFWPATIPDFRDRKASFLGSSETTSLGSSTWSWIAIALTRYPLATLASGIVIVALPAVYGFRHERTVTYDLASQLHPDAMSRRGQELLTANFELGELNPITVLLYRAEAGDPGRTEQDVRRLADQLYDVDGVVAVRTADDPLGDFPPSREMGMLSGDGWKRRTLRNHRIAKGYFSSSVDRFAGRLVRMDVVMSGSPFSVEQADQVTELKTRIERAVSQSGDRWAETQVAYAGTTPSIIDLRAVTLSDNLRIKVAVVVAVFVVLLLVIRRVGLCVYLILTVLVSYFATLGLTVLFFKWLYGPGFVGLDWKLPLFLFVILVAVGQDYNVYLVTRIVEEQKRLGWLAALRRAVSRTGGIITACGMVMAATFFSMTASAWFPPIAEAFGFTVAGRGSNLRGIVELGFALGLGVMIDTFYVRTILVPSFVAVLGRISRAPSRSTESD